MKVIGRFFKGFMRVKTGPKEPQETELSDVEARHQYQAPPPQQPDGVEDEVWKFYLKMRENGSLYRALAKSEQGSDVDAKVSPAGKEAEVYQWFQKLKPETATEGVASIFGNWFQPEKEVQRKSIYSLGQNGQLENYHILAMLAGAHYEVALDYLNQYEGSKPIKPTLLTKAIYHLGVVEGYVSLLPSGPAVPPATIENIKKCIMYGRKSAFQQNGVPKIDLGLAVGYGADIFACQADAIVGAALMGQTLPDLRQLAQQRIAQMVPYLAPVPAANGQYGDTAAVLVQLARDEWPKAECLQQEAEKDLQRRGVCYKGDLARCYTQQSAYQGDGMMNDEQIAILESLKECLLATFDAPNASQIDGLIYDFNELSINNARPGKPPFMLHEVELVGDPVRLRLTFAPQGIDYKADEESRAQAVTMVFDGGRYVSIEQGAEASFVLAAPDPAGKAEFRAIAGESMKYCGGDGTEKKIEPKAEAEAGEQVRHHPEARSMKYDPKLLDRAAAASDVGTGVNDPRASAAGRGPGKGWGVS